MSGPTALPDGSYRIRNRADLTDALRRLSRDRASRSVKQAHITRRAADLDLLDALPAEWPRPASTRTRSAVRTSESRTGGPVRTAPVTGVQLTEPTSAPTTREKTPMPSSTSRTSTPPAPSPEIDQMVDDLIRHRQAAGLMVPRGETPGERYTASVAYERNARNGLLSSSATTVTVRSAVELAARLRTDPDPVTFPALPGHYEILQPGSGGRILPLCTVIPDAGERIEVAVESGRTEAAAPTPYGTDLPETSISFDERMAQAHRIGCSLTTTRGVWSDRGAFRRVVDRLASDEWTRAADVQILTGDGTGEALTGVLETDDLPTQPLGSDTRFGALLRAAMTVRAAEFTGRVTAVLNPADALSLVLETDDAGASTFRPDVLDRLDISLRVSSLIPAGTALVGDWKAGAHVFLRSGVEVAASTQHADDLRKGIVRVTAEARADLTVLAPAFVSITGL